MNWYKLTAAIALSALNLAAFAAHANPQEASQPTEQAAHLDIKKVISIVDNDDGNCGIVDARMTYLDSTGNQKVLEYRKFAGCDNQGG
ncbi:DUF2790 domain-containing protein [Pseudomonas sp. NFX71]|uniref:DUF2790 domain-containing protein n=1 Tax=Pseudomonas sp. NFX71 TaxID=3399121 RepID=UPI003A8B29F3